MIQQIYNSGTSISFSDENGSMFNIMVMPLSDEYEKKEVVAVCNGVALKKGFLSKKPITETREIIEKFTQWDNNPEHINQVSDFLNSNLNKKEVKTETKSHEVKVTHTTAESSTIGEYTHTSKKEY